MIKVSTTPMTKRTYLDYKVGSPVIENDSSNISRFIIRKHSAVTVRTAIATVV